MKKSIFFIYILIVSILVGVSTRIVLASESVLVNFISFPSGAIVTIDGQELGKTPFSKDLATGVHNLRFSLVGFEDWAQDYAIYGSSITISAQLNSSEGLIRLPSEPIYISWANNSNQFRFQASNDTSQTNYVFNIDDKSISRNDLPFLYLEDQNLRSRLSVQNRGNHSIYSIAYQSPSGRYIAYITQKAPGQLNPHLTLYDTKTQKTLETEAVFNEFVDDETNPPFQLIWSPDESSAGIATARYSVNIILFITPDQVQTVYFRSFKNTTGQDVYVDKVFSGPSDQQTMLVTGSVEDQPSQLWLVHLPDMQGTLLQDQTPLSAVLSSDGKFVYWIENRHIIKLDTQNNNRAELGEIPATLGQISAIDFSPTTDYALITIGDPDTATYWLYKIPHN